MFKPRLPDKKISKVIEDRFYLYESVSSFLEHLNSFKERCKLEMGREVNDNEISLKRESCYGDEYAYLFEVCYEIDNGLYNYQLDKYNKDMELYKEFIKKEFENLK